MSDVTTKPQPRTGEGNRRISRDLDPAPRVRPPRRWRILPLFITGAAVALAVVLGQPMWATYMTAPWTRDGTVRAYVVTIAPEVSGRIVSQPVTDNQFVHKGELLMEIDPTDYTIAVSLAEAAVRQTQSNVQNVNAKMEVQQAQISANMAQLDRAQAALVFAQQQARRFGILARDGAGSTQDAQQSTSQLHQQEAEVQSAQQNLNLALRQVDSLKAQRMSAEGTLAQAKEQLRQAGVNLDRTRILSPVDGYVTNLLAQRGDYATAGQNLISITDADSFWVDGYFEESSLDQIHVSDPAEIKLMGYRQILHGRVASIARAIDVANAQPNREGVATVNPIFTWVRLAQRIPVRIHIDQVPQDVILVAGMTATVQIDPSPPTGIVRRRPSGGVAVSSAGSISRPVAVPVARSRG